MSMQMLSESCPDASMSAKQCAESFYGQSHDSCAALLVAKRGQATMSRRSIMRGPLLPRTEWQIGDDEEILLTVVLMLLVQWKPSNRIANPIACSLPHRDLRPQGRLALVWQGGDQLWPRPVFHTISVGALNARSFLDVVHRIHVLGFELQ